MRFHIYLCPSRRQRTRNSILIRCLILKQDGGDEADDEGSGKAANKSHVHQQAASLNITAARGSTCFSRANSFGRKPGVGEELGHWESLNEVGSVCSWIPRGSFADMVLSFFLELKQRYFSAIFDGVRKSRDADFFGFMAMCSGVQSVLFTYVGRSPRPARLRETTLRRHAT